MVGKLIGALCILASCGSFGFYLAYRQIRELKLLDQWIRILCRIEMEIRYQLRSIPEVFRLISLEEKGSLGCFFIHAAQELESQIQPDVDHCTRMALYATNGLPDTMIVFLENLGNELGRYEIDGQLQGIERIKECSRERRNFLLHDKTKRIRGYQTLGLCAGAALVILFI